MQRTLEIQHHAGPKCDPEMSQQLGYIYKDKYYIPAYLTTKCNTHTSNYAQKTIYTFNTRGWYFHNCVTALQHSIATYGMGPWFAGISRIMNMQDKQVLPERPQILGCRLTFHTWQNLVYQQLPEKHTVETWNTCQYRLRYMEIACLIWYNVQPMYAFLLRKDPLQGKWGRWHWWEYPKSHLWHVSFSR